MNVQERMRRPSYRTQVRDLLRAFGLQPSDSNVEQMAVFLEAVAVHDDRARRYADHWVQNGAAECLLNARRKVLRQISVLNVISEETKQKQLEEGSDDDAIDGMNYLAFFVRNLRNLNIDGTTE